MNITILIQILSFLASNRAQIKELVLAIESMLPDAPGTSKANTVKQFIGAALGITEQIEAVWPAVAPLFNAFVGLIKSPK